MADYDSFEDLQQAEWAAKLGAGRILAGPGVVTSPQNEGTAFAPEPGAQSPPGGAVASAALPSNLNFDNLVEVADYIYPDITLNSWQVEELYRCSGYVDGTRAGPRVEYTKDNPYLAVYPCANGSGKDKILFAIISIGNCLIYRNTNVVGTSASFDQLKYQTENHLTNAIAALNKRAGFKVFESVSLYHSCPATGSWIKLFATNEPGRAEGWHPDTPNGKLLIMLNEVKTINNELLDSFDRCHGFSMRVEVSSPGGRSGMLYNNWKKSIKYPARPVPFKYFGRRITGDQCPHLNPKILEMMIDKHGINSFLVQTSWFANFWEESVGVAIPAGLVDDCDGVENLDGEIGIGLDCAAGGDETVLIIRRGNHILDMFCFTEANLVTAAAMLDSRLDSYRFVSYEFNADDGGVGRGLLDNLAGFGWRITRRHMQSASYDKTLYANLAAELYWHCRDLFQARLIPKPADELLYNQLITRKDDVSEGNGKHKLASKKRIKELGGSSPDRADAYCLAFFSYRPRLGARKELAPPEEDGPMFSLNNPDDLRRYLRRHHFVFQPIGDSAPTGRPTDMRIAKVNSISTI